MTVPGPFVRGLGAFAMLDWSSAALVHVHFNWDQEYGVLPLEIPGQAGKANSFGFSQPNHFSPSSLTR